MSRGKRSQFLKKYSKFQQIKFQARLPFVVPVLVKLTKSPRSVPDSFFPLNAFRTINRYLLHTKDCGAKLENTSFACEPRTPELSSSWSLSFVSGLKSGRKW